MIGRGFLFIAVSAIFCLGFAQGKAQRINSLDAFCPRGHGCIQQCLLQMCACPSSTTQTTQSDQMNCTQQEHCSADQACVQHRCIDPCKFGCGDNSECVVVSHKAVCRCKAGYSGDPVAGCLLGEPRSTSLVCDHHDNCHTNNACINSQCVDPCLDEVCGKNAICSVRHHLPSCGCQEGYTGDPFSECRPQVRSGCWPPSKNGKKKFKVETTIKSDWTSALIHCQMEGKRLAAINSKEENDRILDDIAETGTTGGNFWTSGTDMTSEGRFIWQTTGERISKFRDWGEGQPDNANNVENCVELWDSRRNGVYKWNDRPCQEKHNFVCEYYE